jgi:hypothetical protein
MRAVIGIDRKIKRAWLDVLLDHLAQSAGHEELRRLVDERLAEELPGAASHAKSVGISLKIWSGIPANRVPLRDRVIGLLPKISGQERVWLHWGMTSLAYPFFRDTAEVVGRLLTLQDDFTTAQVQERLLKKWGDRATTKEAAQKLLQTLVDWEVLRPTKAKGHFLGVARVSSASTALQLWLLESLLAAGPTQEVEAQQLLRLPEMFPFSLSIGLSDLRRQDGFQIHRQGIDMDMVSLRPITVATPAKPPKKTAKRKSKETPPTLFRDAPEERPQEQVPKPAAAREARVVTDRIEVPPARPGPILEPAAIEQAPEPIREEAPADLAGMRRARLVEGWERPDQVPFSAPINECLRLFREGQDLACIALGQETITAILRRVGQVKLGPRQAKAVDVRNQFAGLSASGALPLSLKTRLEQLWFQRLDYLEFVGTEANNRVRLESLAENHVGILIELVGLYLGFTLDRGEVCPDHPEYWSLGRKVGTAKAEAVV